MPPKRRVVKTVRKSTPNSKSKISTTAGASAADEKPSTPSPAANANPTSPAIAAGENLTTPVPVSGENLTASVPDENLTNPVHAPNENRVTLATAPTPAPAPAAEQPKITPLARTLPFATASETPGSDPVGPAPQPSGFGSSPAPSKGPAEAELGLSGTFPADASLAVAESQVATSAPSGAGKKTTIRVRKVIKKKIIKKRIPKVLPEAKKDLDLLQPLTEIADQQTPVTESRPENPSSDIVVEEAVLADNAGMEEKDVHGEQEKEEEREETTAAALDEEAQMSERQSRRKTEIFIGGLSRDAKEEDLRKVFGEVGEIVEIRMMMDGQTRKNKGYAFLRYKEAGQARRAVSKFPKVEICGKLCGAAALEGNDTIFLGNIDKKWKKEDVMKLLQDIGIEKIDTVTVMADPNDADINRGFAFIELETNRDAHIAYRKLQKKDIFGKGRNIKVAWAEPLNDPDEEEMQKVKSVYIEGIPSSWNEAKLREFFKKFGEIERIVLSRDIHSAKRKDFAFVNYTTREAALSCIKSFDKELPENVSKVNLKVSLAKPVQKNKQHKGISKPTSTEVKHKPVQSQVKASASSYKGSSFRRDHSSGGDKKTSTTNELLQVLREQATWRQGQMGYSRGPVIQDYSHTIAGGKRPFSALGEDPSYSDVRGYPHARLNTYPVSSSSYGAPPPSGMPGSSLPYYQHSNPSYSSGTRHGVAEYSGSYQNQGFPPYGSSMYSRYR